MILVTGSNGLIGRALLQVLLSNDEKIRAHTRTKLPTVPSSQTLVSVGTTTSTATAAASVASSAGSRSELTNAVLDFASAGSEDYNQLLSGCDTVIHTAGLVHAPKASAEEFDKLNTEATEKLVLAANQNGIKNFVFLSTSAVYGSAFENIKEDAPLKPDTPYASSKIACEELIAQRSQAERVITLRPSLVFGEGDRGNMLSLIKQIQKGRYVNIKGNEACKSIIYSMDAAYAIALCLKTLSPGHYTFNLANPNPVGVNELADFIARGLGKSAPRAVSPGILNTGAIIAETLLGVRSPLTKDRLRKLTTSTTLDISALQQSTGFSPSLTVEESLAAEIGWLREQG